MTMEEVIAVCCCPCCRNPLALGEKKNEIRCGNGHVFPLLNGRIPLLIVDAERSQEGSADFINKNTSKSFSRQWRLYKPGDKIWGMTPQQLKELFLKESGWREEDFKGKRILDLGCGHGVHSRFLAEMGADVIGCDVSQGFFHMDAQLPDDLRERLHYIQGDIFNFPLKDNVFDFVWSEGVLHHTPDTNKAYRNVNGATKKGGRMYISLYHKGAPYYKYQNAIRQITTRLPGWALSFLCYAAAPFFGLLKWALNKTKKGARHFEKRSWRENAVSLHDTYSPPYAWHHSKDEVTGWFKEAGFTNIVTSEVGPHLFGIRGDKI